MAKELLSGKLKIRTLAPHQELEKLLMQRMRSMATVDDYIRLLRIFYSYFGGLEDQIKIYIGIDLIPDYQQRRKSAALGSDISSLGGMIPYKIPAEDLPLIENKFQALGALYVIEGSTLGGVIISKMIGKQLGVAEENLTFFRSYGDNLVTMWASFKAILDSQAENIKDAELVLGAATETFQKFSALLKRY